jgi:hypothetical protein
VSLAAGDDATTETASGHSIATSLTIIWADVIFGIFRTLQPRALTDAEGGGIHGRFSHLLRR